MWPLVPEIRRVRSHREENHHLIITSSQVSSLLLLINPSFLRTVAKTISENLSPHHGTLYLNPRKCCPFCFAQIPSPAPPNPRLPRPHACCFISGQPCSMQKARPPSLLCQENLTSVSSPPSGTPYLLMRSDPLVTLITRLTDLPFMALIMIRNHLFGVKPHKGRDGITPYCFPTSLVSSPSIEVSA